MATFSDTMRLNSLHDLFKILAEVDQSLLDNPPVNVLWWRGEVDSEWHLSPAAERHYKNLIEERGATYRFMQKAGSRHNNVPKSVGPYCDQSYVEWLFLMQHYGLPTRLLDWTESLFVALFFAVYYENKYWEKDGVLWALNPCRLNQDNIDTDGCCTPTSPKIDDICKIPFGNEDPANIPDQKIVALIPDQKDIRMLMQHSTFTLHSGWPIQKFNNDPKDQRYLKKIIISSSKKKEIYQFLIRCGLNISNIFPDLENLSKEIKNMYFI